MRKRLTAALLCLCLCLTLFPTAAYAQEGSVTVNRAGEGPGEETPRTASHGGPRLHL